MSACGLGTATPSLGSARNSQKEQLKQVTENTEWLKKLTEQLLELGVLPMDYSPGG
jgi:L-lysine 2,3-aminomutase